MARRPGPGRARRGLFAPLTGTQPVARYESAVINRRVDREVTPGDTQAMLVARDGTWVTKGVVENFLDTPGFATTATTSLHLLVARHATRRRWPARRRRSPRWAAASRSTAAGRRRWRSTA